ncbi:MAG: single-stranded DNA-binding protein [Bacteroidaceae bacterium]|nr:single-stranded DNA-binding protein [Bacteroidaceae bacterium]
MPSINKVILLGHVGKEPEVRYVDQGVAVAQVRLATTERGYTLPNGTQVPDRTEWHNVVLWRKLAETVEKYVHTGDFIYVEGKIQSRTYEDKQGITRYITEIWADDLKLFGSKKDTNTNG